MHWTGPCAAGFYLMQKWQMHLQLVHNQLQNESLWLLIATCMVKMSVYLVVKCIMIFNVSISYWVGEYCYIAPAQGWFNYALCAIVSISQGGITFMSDFRVTHCTTSLRMFSLLLLLLNMCLVLEAIVLLCLLNVITLLLQTYRTPPIQYDADRYM